MVQWTAEKDQKLLRGVVEFCDIKLSGPLLQHLAGLIGEGCTVKAVNHRLFNIKNAGKKDAPVTPSKANQSISTNNTPATPSTKGRGGNKNKPEGEPINELLAPTPKKRGRPTKAESEARKRVKVENVEHEPFSRSPDKSDGVVDEV